jgi:hypothetical protein
MHVTDRMLYYLDGALSDESRAIVDRHLATCEVCQEELEMLRRGHDALRALPPTSVPPEFADRVLARTRLAGTWERAWLRLSDRQGLAAAAVLLAVAAVLGAWAGRMSAPTPTPTTVAADPPANDGPQFLLLLIQQDDLEPRVIAERVSAYQAWAMELESSGRLVTAEKLGEDSGEWVRPPDVEFDPTVMAASSMTLGGFFQIRAATYEEAEEIARASPHVGFGGTILIRRVDFH